MLNLHWQGFFLNAGETNDNPSYLIYATNYF